MNKTQFKALVNGLREGTTLSSLEQLKCFRGISLKAALKGLKLTAKEIKTSRQFSVLLERPVDIASIEVLKFAAKAFPSVTDDDKGAAVAVSLAQQDAALILVLDEHDYVFLNLSDYYALSVNMSEQEIAFIKGTKPKTEKVNPALLAFALQVI